jgi:hypothetical protein
MNRRFLLGYQLIIGISDTVIGTLLIVAPEFTLDLTGIQVPSGAIPFVSFIGAFVFSVGFACLYGAWLTARDEGRARVEMIWLLTAITRTAVAIILAQRVMAGTLQAAWLIVAISDGAFTLIQAVGLRMMWVAHAIAE